VPSTNVESTLFTLLFVAGDITDAKLEDREGSRQFEDEWRQYDQVLHETGILDKTVWLDTRGNHGIYDILDVHHFVRSVLVAQFSVNMYMLF